MRFLILIALCLAVASASYSNRNRFNRLLRDLQRQQQQQQGYGYGSQGLSYNNEYDSEEQDEDDEDNYYQQQQQQRNQCQRNQRYGNLNLDDEENDYNNDEQNDEQDQYNQYDQDDDQDQYQNQNQRQGRQGRQGRHGRQGHQQQQQKRHQQQQHQCQPKYQLLQALEEANTQLASKLYKQAKQENDDKNTVVSPAAVQLALAAIQRGARGNTKRQLQRITGAGLNKQQNQQAHTALQQSLQGQQQQQENGQNQQAKIKTTTTIIINQRNRAQQQFVQAVRACLNTQVKKCNFQHQHQQCRQQINRHIAQKTNQKLQHVVPQDAVTANTKLIVVNTAQVNAKWSRQVRQQQQTKQGRFYALGQQQPKQVQVLKTQGQMNYYEDEQLQVVGVPTQQQELTLYVIVPKDKDGLNQIEKSQIQNGQQLKQLLENAEQQQEQVQLELPKFQIQHKIDAKQTLRQQGVQDAFDQDEANFAGINGQQNQEQQQNQHRRRQQQQGQDSDEEDQYEQDQDQQQNQQNQQNQQQLHVNKLIHQATIKINEQGISAAQTRRNQQQQNQYQYQDQDQDQDQDEDDQEDEQEQQYRNQQEERQELLEEIFGQRQQRHGRNQQQQRRNRRNQQQQYNNQYQGQQGQAQQVKANRAFAFALKHNPSNQIILVGRVVDAAQKPKNQQQQQGRQQGQQSLNGVDQQ